MCKKRCPKMGEADPGSHVHIYCAYTSVDDGHRHMIREVTAPAQNSPCHKHRFEGETTCNSKHVHSYCGETGGAEPVCGGHVHNLWGKTACAEGHKHHYCDTTETEKPYCRDYRY